MDEIFLITGFRSMSVSQRALFLDYAQALRDKLETAPQLEEALFETLTLPDSLDPNKLPLTLSLLELSKSDEGNQDQCLEPYSSEQ